MVIAIASAHIQTITDTSPTTGESETKEEEEENSEEVV